MPTPAIVDDLASIPSIDSIDEEIRAGLPSDRGRLDEAMTNEDFYQLDNLKHLERRESEDELDYQRRPKRTSKLTRCVVRKLSEPLYNPGPVRLYEQDAALHEWLEGVYRDVHVNTRMQQADRASTLNHVAAIQVEATKDPNQPIRLWLWKGHEFAVFCRDDDPMDPWCVVTIEAVPAGYGRMRTRYRAWTAAERRTYLTAEWTVKRTSGGRRADVIVAEESGPTPYPGVLPFVFLRAEPAESKFWAGGIGTAVRECNQELDRALSDLGQHVFAYLNPIPYAKNCSIQERLVIRPGKFVHLKADPAARAGDMKAEPELAYLQADLAVEQAWYDLKTYADETLEELEVPLTLVRTDDPREMSGVAIQAKASPLVQRTRARQPQWTEHEVELTAKIMAVAGAWHGEQRLLAAARDPKLTVVWPEPKVIDTLTAEGLDALQRELDMGMADPFEALARLRGITIEQAEELAEQIADRRKRWATLMGVEATDPAEKPGATDVLPDDARNADDQGGELEETDEGE